MFIPFKPTICRSFCKRFSLWFFQTFFGMFTPGPTSFNLGTKLYLILYILSNEKTSQYIIIPLYPVIIPLYPIISHYIPLYPIISHYMCIYIYTHIPLYPIIYHYISHYIPLYPIICVYIYTYTIIYHYISHYIYMYMYKIV